MDRAIENTGKSIFFEASRGTPSDGRDGKSVWDFPIVTNIVTVIEELTTVARRRLPVKQDSLAALTWCVTWS
jgi:hypothetical protein